MGTSGWSAPSAWERYVLDGVRASVPPSEVPDSLEEADLESHTGADRLAGQPVPLRRPGECLALRDGGSGEEVRRLVHGQPVSLLLAEDGAVVVREDDQVIRYTLQSSYRIAP